MTSIVDECAQQCLLPDGQSTLYDALPPFDEELARDVTVEELSLSPPAEPLDDNQGASGSSLPATPAERPCTFCPSSLPLPPATCSTRATLVLDLDGTLIASEELNAGNSSYLWNTPAGARTPDYEAMGRRVWLRPGVREFLVAVRPHFEIILFTAATQNWAAAAIEQLDPAAELFDVMLHRDHTTSDLMWDYVKDLSRLGRDLARVVIVDDNPLMFMYQPDNALHIGAYEAAIAGGPDNVLPRVADVLINQVAPAIDVREVLGPMASSKSCITSTVSAAAPTLAAAEPHAQAAELSSVTADGHEAVGVMDCSATCCTASSGEGMQCDASGEGQWGVGVGGCAEEGEQQQQGALTQQLQLEGGQCSSGFSREGESNCSLTDNADKCVEWDGESEGAETFDEHGAAAPLGADVAGTRQGHQAWDSTRVSSDTAVAVAETEAVAQESGEQEESDACPHEEHSVHSSEDFEALMDDAMAEYDSDAYEGSYGDGAGYDHTCPAETAIGATVEASALPDHPATGSQFGGDSSYCEFGYPISSSLRSCGRPAACADGVGVGQKNSIEFCIAAAETSSHHACSDAADAGAEHSSDGAVATGAAHPAPLTCSEAAGPLAPLLQSPAAEDVQRQPQLPTGMVFLMDVNPAFGTGCPSSDASQQPAAGSREDAPPPLPQVASAEGDGRAGEVLGCKRVRADADADSGESDGARGVVARLSCEGTPHSSRVRAAGADAHIISAAATDS